MENIYYTSELIGTESTSDLNYLLQDSLGFDYDSHDDFIEIRRKSFKGYNTYESTPFLIDTLISLLMDAKSKGANYVEIENGVDSRGYDMSFLKIDPATQQDIESYKDKKEREAKAEREMRRKRLEDEIKRLTEYEINV